MKKAIMSAHVRMGAGKNLGDYNQAIAARQFMNVDEFIDRDELRSYNGKECKLIMNGWFMHNPEEFPPSEKIVPLITSFHVSPRKADMILREDGVNYLKKHEPIGCRDHVTLKILSDKGIKAYFSGCLTLTLGRTYSHRPEKKNVLFVDPVLPFTDGSPVKKAFNISIISFMVMHFRKVSVLGRKFRDGIFGMNDGLKGLLRALYAAAAFFKTYRRMFSERLLLSADYISNITSWDGIDKTGNVDKQFMDMADGLLKTYEKYPLVITSRIHCALPCTAMGTPVVFMNDRRGRNTMGGIIMGDGRFDGLIEFFNVIDFDDKWRMKPRNWSIDKITEESEVPRKDNWRVYAQKLAEQCAEFAAN